MDADTKMAVGTFAALAALIALGAWYSMREEERATSAVLIEELPPEP